MSAWFYRWVSGVVAGCLVTAATAAGPEAAAEPPAAPPTVAADWQPPGSSDAVPATAPAAPLPPQTESTAVDAPERPPDTAPATGPVPPPTDSAALQRTPARMMSFFLTATREADEQPDRLAAAMGCLDFALLDPAVVAAEGLEYTRRAGAIVQALVRMGAFEPGALPDEPAAGTRVIGREPLLLIIDRREDRQWRFSPSTVAEIPDLYRRLQELEAAPASAPTTEATPPSEPLTAKLSSPRALVRQFLIAVNDAERNPDFYPAALACLNFAGLDAAVAAEQGARYADQLQDVLQRLLDLGLLKLEDLPEETTETAFTIGREPVVLVLARQDAGYWQFAARTVAQIPTLHGQLGELAAAKSVPAGPGPGGAEEPSRAAKSAAGADVPPEYRSPRATMVTFLKAMNEDDLRTAIRCLDLSGLSDMERDASARLLAGKLLLVMNRHKVVVPQEISDDPLFEGPYKHLIDRYGRIEIARQVGGERAGEWLFSAATVKSVERLYDAWETRPLLPEFRADPGVSLRTLPSLWLRERVIPADLKRTGLWLQHWQWIGLGLALLLGWVAQRLTRAVVPRLARRLLHIPGATRDAGADLHVLRPLALLALVATWWAGLQFVDLGARVVGLVWPAIRFVLVAAAAWTLYTLIDVAAGYVAERAAQRGLRLDDVVVSLARKTLKVTVVAIGVLLMLATLGFKVEPLLAGLGIGGLAFSFAAKDTLSNFFGSVNVVLDRTFQVGDWVKIGAHEGMVESVGLRSSRLRTFYNSELTIPNAEIMNAVIDNLGRRRYRRTLLTLSVTYQTTPEQLEALCEGVRELIRRHPLTRKDLFYVSVRGFSASSIDVLVDCFHDVSEYAVELRERHRLLLDILRLAARLGIEFAYPTQTVFVRAADAGEAAAANAPGPAAPPLRPPPLPVPADTAAAQLVGRDAALAVLAAQPAPGG